MLGVICVDFAPPYNDFTKIDIVFDVIVEITGHNGSITNTPIYYSCNEPYVLLVTV